jgi:hypothetical protein
MAVGARKSSVIPKVKGAHAKAVDLPILCVHSKIGKSKSSSGIIRHVIDELLCVLDIVRRKEDLQKGK